MFRTVRASGTSSAQQRRARSSTPSLLHLGIRGGGSFHGKVSGERSTGTQNLCYTEQSTGQTGGHVGEFTV